MRDVRESHVQSQFDRDKLVGPALPLLVLNLCLSHTKQVIITFA